MDFLEVPVSQKEKQASTQAIRVLDEGVSKRIAAGEVIDRPHAALRELLDNAIDSGASNITVHVNGGGIQEIRVSDDGRGMSFDDLKLCWLPHATSKITSLEDLEKIHTLGFRGEALSSMAACARLEIISATDQGANTLAVHGSKLLEITPSSGAKGTTVSVRDLFFNMPARRQFLGSPRSEGSRCRRIFFEKSAAHPGINFRFFVDGVIKSYLPAGTFQDRIRAAWPQLAPDPAWWQSEWMGEDFQLQVVHARAEFSRRDRKYIHIYANRRRIDEYALMQGVAHAYDAYLPGGAFPMAFVFLEVSPALVDFNIHPAKKEARFRDLPGIRHRLVDSIQNRLSEESYRSRHEARKEAGEIKQAELPSMPHSPVHKVHSTGSSHRKKSSTFEHQSQRQQSEAFAEAVGEVRNASVFQQKLRRHTPAPMDGAIHFRYLGQVMGVFLVAESADSLFIVDQHAAHERILFDKLRISNPSPQKLLIPRPLNMEKEALMRLELRKERLKALGLGLEQSGEGQWNLTALPEAALNLEKEIVEFVESGAGEVENLEKSLWADLACKAAVKDNNILDDQAAEKLLQDAFNLKTPRCPHGRPIWFEVSRRELFELVGRKV